MRTEFWWGDLIERDQRCRLDDNIKMYIQEVGCGGVDWIGLT